MSAQNIYFHGEIYFLWIPLLSRAMCADGKSFGGRSLHAGLDLCS